MEHYHYAAHFDDLQPADLEIRADELAALGDFVKGANRGSRLSGKALKVATKSAQFFEARRLLAAHLFYMPSRRFWHLLYFDQRDTTWHDNHWKMGPHIHYANDLLCREPIDTVWHKVTRPKPEFPKRSLHIRYDYHHNRKWLNGSGQIAPL